MTSRALVLACLLARLVAGATLLRSGVEKVRAGFVANHGVEKYVRAQLDANAPFHFFRGFLEHVALPRAQLLSYLVVAGELLIGTCLLLGFLTRWAGFFGFVMMATFALAAGKAIDPAPPVGFGLLLLVLAASGVGRVAGLDGWLAGRAPRWLV
jgi:thiosulfate dehydrogenase [quinone] large subunit